MLGILLLVIFALIVKVYFLHKSAKEIAEAFRDRLTTDTNTLIAISSRDPYIRHLASEINKELRLLRKERHRYQQGDLELKEAVTNISHDLRTPLTAINGYLDLLEKEEKTGTHRFSPDIGRKSAVFLCHYARKKIQPQIALPKQPVWFPLDIIAVIVFFPTLSAIP